MSTRSTIARLNEDGSFDSIYCHWDGYPSNNGKILLEHYNDPAKVDALLQLGNLSSLGPELGRKHPFNWRMEAYKQGDYRCEQEPSKTYNQWCLAHGRDRGEKRTKARRYKSAVTFSRMLKESWTEWVYVFHVSDGKWRFSPNDGGYKHGEELTAEAIAADL